MVTSRRIRLAVALAPVLACALATPALAASPATVTVRVEGLNETKVPATQVTTTTAPVSGDGDPEHSCSGTSALGALQLATAGAWSGTWFGPEFGYSIETIAGESHTFEPEATANYFWSLWIDERESEVGACGAELESGERVLLFPSCFGTTCPAAQLPLGVEAPASADLGEPVDVSVARYSPSGTRAAAAGASVSGNGVAAASTDGSGHATITFTQPGLVTLRVTAPESVRTETTVCVHNRNDGTCGTTAPGSPASGPGPTSQPYKGVYALVAHVSGLSEGHVYSRHHGPRLLSGVVSSHSPVDSVSLLLRRRDHGRCSSYDGTTERFRHARCGTGSFFHVSNSGAFSYLLPAALGRGRYVLDIRASDTAGNQVALARGTSRTVFYVR